MGEFCLNLGVSLSVPVSDYILNVAFALSVVLSPLCWPGIPRGSGTWLTVEGY